MNDSVVYHTSAVHGIKIFKPKPYWHTKNFSMSGILAEGIEPKEGACHSDLFFAIGREMVPMFFSPKDVIKHGVFGGAISRKARSLLGIKDDRIERIIVFAAEDEARLIRHSFSIYAFLRSEFREVPSGEYVSETLVSPIRETRCSNVIDETRNWGIHVSFVEDIVLHGEQMQM